VVKADAEVVEEVEDAPQSGVQREDDEKSSSSSSSSSLSSSMMAVGSREEAAVVEAVVVKGVKDEGRKEKRGGSCGWSCC